METITTVAKQAKQGVKVETVATKATVAKQAKQGVKVETKATKAKQGVKVETVAINNIGNLMAQIEEDKQYLIKRDKEDAIRLLAHEKAKAEREVAETVTTVAVTESKYLAKVTAIHNNVNEGKISKKSLFIAFIADLTSGIDEKTIANDLKSLYKPLKCKETESVINGILSTAKMFIAHKFTVLDISALDVYTITALTKLLDGLNKKVIDGVLASDGTVKLKYNRDDKKELLTLEESIKRVKNRLQNNIQKKYQVKQDNALVIPQTNFRDFNFDINVEIKALNTAFSIDFSQLHYFNAVNNIIEKNGDALNNESIEALISALSKCKKLA